MIKIGFVLLSHNNPEMLRRLVLRLNHDFDHPPIACHHDSHQLQIDVSAFSSNVKFVAQPVRTQWGHISVVHAFRLALRRLYDRAPPDWFVYLSAADYPIRTSDSIVSELSSTVYDAYLDFRRIQYGKLPRGFRDHGFEQGFQRPFWVKVAYDRYFARRFHYPAVNRHFRPAMRRFHVRHPALLAPNPFHDDFGCFAGDAWLTANCFFPRKNP